LIERKKPTVKNRYVLHLIAGARPNFMKAAPIMRAFAEIPEVDCRLIHTGQHYDPSMSAVFFTELGIPDPAVHLDVGSGSHAEQTAKIMIAYEQCCLAAKPDLVIVVGDVNSTVACSLVAKKLQIPVAHVEAGLRSRDLSMPEEINRMVTDAISDLCYVTESEGEKNLLHEGKTAESVVFVGHVMIDNLFYQLGKLRGMDESEFEFAEKKRALGRYGIVTLHRPSNVDEEPTLRHILGALFEISKSLPLIFPVHPRTRARIELFGVKIPDSVTLTPPLPFMEFLNLWKDAVVVLTDSGGLQEETTSLGIPCLTLRENTERPVTADIGTNVVVGTDAGKIVAEARKVIAGTHKKGQQPRLWDGNAAQRIAAHMIDWLRARTLAKGADA
jgi:UDP-N-acetylglucosamine 2-epimerase (non-hydrolysing)